MNHSFDKLVLFSRLNSLSYVVSKQILFDKARPLNNSTQNRLLRRYTLKKSFKTEENFIRRNKIQETAVSLIEHGTLMPVLRRVSLPHITTVTLFKAKRQKHWFWQHINYHDRRYLNTGDPFLHGLFKWKPSNSISEKREYSPLQTLNNTPLVLVEDKHSLYNMVLQLKQCREIGIDVEHVTISKEENFTVLIQISTREKDYIVDPIPLWDKLCLLNEVLADESITKVIHGIGSDAHWLKRDFGLRIINAFDTQVAADWLPYRSISLASLVQHHCDVSLDKTLRTADWSVRPLTEQMINYARSDSHYLLFLFDALTGALIEKGQGPALLKQVYRKTKQICLKIYQKPTCPRGDIRTLMNSAKERQGVAAEDETKG